MKESKSSAWEAFITAKGSRSFRDCTPIQQVLLCGNRKCQKGILKKSPSSPVTTTSIIPPVFHWSSIKQSIKETTVALTRWCAGLVKVNVSILCQQHHFAQKQKHSVFYYFIFLRSKSHCLAVHTGGSIVMINALKAYLAGHHLC